MPTWIPESSRRLLWAALLSLRLLPALQLPYPQSRRLLRAALLSLRSLPALQLPYPQSRQLLWAALLSLRSLPALQLPYPQSQTQRFIHTERKAHACMDPGSELEYEMPGFLRLYKRGRIERFDGTDTVPPSPSGDPANGVASKDVVLDPAAGISARLYLPPAAAAAPGKKLPVVIFFHGGAFVVHTAASPLYHMYAASLAAAIPAVVVSADYRLAPEHRVPAAYDDAFAALKVVVAACRPDGAEPWLAAHGDASRVVLTSDSVGACWIICGPSPYNKNNSY